MKDGKKLEALVGRNARLFDDRIYVQARAINETFFDSEELTWVSSSHYAASNHMNVSAAPLTNDEATNIRHTAFAKANKISGIKQKRAYLRPFFTDSTPLSNEEREWSSLPRLHTELSEWKYHNHTSFTYQLIRNSRLSDFSLLLGKDNETLFDY